MHERITEEEYCDALLTIGKMNKKELKAFIRRIQAYNSKLVNFNADINLDLLVHAASERLEHTD